MVYTIGTRLFIGTDTKFDLSSDSELNFIEKDHQNDFGHLFFALVILLFEKDGCK